VALIRALLVEEQRRKAAGRVDTSIPFRPDHGQEILSDIDTASQPGYPAMGRLKGLHNFGVLSRHCRMLIQASWRFEPF